MLNCLIVGLNLTLFIKAFQFLLNLNYLLFSDTLNVKLKIEIAFLKINFSF